MPRNCALTFLRDRYFLMESKVKNFLQSLPEFKGTSLNFLMTIGCNLAPNTKLKYQMIELKQDHVTLCLVTGVPYK